MARPTAAGRQRGVVLLMLLIVIALMGVGLAATGTVWHEVQLRAKERELLFVGMQYRDAIRRYYIELPGASRYPPTLEALLRDERVPGVRRHLRRPYRDPLTNAANWGLVEAPGGGIMGVYSLAEGRPLKRANFAPELGWNEGKQSYADWRFVYLPPSGQSGF